MPITQRVTAEAGLERITAEFGTKVRDARLNFGEVDITVDPGDLVEVAQGLRDAEGIECRFFTFLAGVDRTEFGGEDKEQKAGGLEVLIHLYSPEHGLHVNVHVPVDAAEPRCPSLVPLFLGAFWHEREAFEMFGIDFEDHPRLVNLLLPEDFEGHPGLRSFKLPTRIVKDWPGAKDPEEAAAGGR